MPEDTQTGADDVTCAHRAVIDASARGPVLAFVTAGAAWLLVATALGLFAAIKFVHPDWLGSLSILHYGRIKPAMMDAFVYGWCIQVGVGVSIWIMSRLSRVPLASSWLIHTGVWIWNIALTIGIFSILLGGNTSIEWLEFPAFVWPFLLIAYIFVTVWLVLAFRVRNAEEAYISQWYILAAAFWFPWIFATANILIRHFDGGAATMGAAINAWYTSAVLLLFLVPVGLGSVYYMIPKIIGRKVHSYQLAQIGFWTLAALSGWAGVQKLLGGPVPAWMGSVGGAATILMLIPVGVVALNHHLSVRGHHKLAEYSPTLRFTIFGAVAYTLMSVVAVLLCLVPVARVTQLTQAVDGFHFLSLYGFFTMTMFGALYFIMPRLSGCEWPSSRLAKIHFWFTTYGLFALIILYLCGGIFQGLSMHDPGNLDGTYIGTVSVSLGFVSGTWIAWGFLLFANTAFFFHVLLMALRLGRRSQDPTLFGKPHEPDTAAAH